MSVTQSWDRAIIGPVVPSADGWENSETATDGTEPSDPQALGSCLKILGASDAGHSILLSPALSSLGIEEKKVGRTEGKVT